MYFSFYLFGNKPFDNLRTSICQTILLLLSNNSGGKFVQNVNFRLHFVLFAVFYVILRRTKPLLKRDGPIKTLIMRYTGCVNSQDKEIVVPSK